MHGRVGALLLCACLPLAGCGGHRPAAAPAPQPAPLATTGPKATAGLVPLDTIRAEAVRAFEVTGDGQGGAFAATTLTDGPDEDGQTSCTAPPGITTRVVHVAVDPVRSVARTTLPGLLQAGPVALGAGRSAVLLDAPATGRATCGDEEALTLVTLDRAGRVTERRPLEAHAVVSAADLVADTQGRPRAAWVVEDTNGATLRDAAPDGGPARTLATRHDVDPQGEGPQVALGRERAGHVLVAFAARPTVRAFDVDAAGRPGRVQRLGVTSDRIGLSVATRNSGRAAVLWGSIDGGESRDTPYVVRAALRSAGATRFGPAQVLDPGRALDDPDAPPLLRLDKTGRVLAAWANADQLDDDTLRTAVAAPGADRFGPARRGERVYEVMDLRLQPDGSALVLTRRGGDPVLQLLAPDGMPRERRTVPLAGHLLASDFDAPLLGLSGDHGRVELVLATH